MGNSRVGCRAKKVTSVFSFCHVTVRDTESMVPITYILCSYDDALLKSTYVDAICRAAFPSLCRFLSWNQYPHELNLMDPSASPPPRACA